MSAPSLTRRTQIPGDFRHVGFASLTTPAVGIDDDGFAYPIDAGTRLSVFETHDGAFGWSESDDQFVPVTDADLADWEQDR